MRPNSNSPNSPHSSSMTPSKRKKVSRGIKSGRDWSPSDRPSRGSAAQKPSSTAKSGLSRHPSPAIRGPVSDPMWATTLTYEEIATQLTQNGPSLQHLDTYTCDGCLSPGPPHDWLAEGLAADFNNMFGFIYALDLNIDEGETLDTPTGFVPVGSHSTFPGTGANRVYSGHIKCLCVQPEEVQVTTINHEGKKVPILTWSPQGLARMRELHHSSAQDRCAICGMGTVGGMLIVEAISPPSCSGYRAHLPCALFTPGWSLFEISNGKFFFECGWPFQKPNCFNPCDDCLCQNPRKMSSESPVQEPTTLKCSFAGCSTRMKHLPCAITKRSQRMISHRIRGTDTELYEGTWYASFHRRYSQAGIGSFYSAFQTNHSQTDTFKTVRGLLGQLTLEGLANGAKLVGELIHSRFEEECYRDGQIIEILELVHQAWIRDLDKHAEKITSILQEIEVHATDRIPGADFLCPSHSQFNPYQCICGELKETSSTGKKVINWVACDICQMWYHEECLDKIPKSDTYTCSKCIELDKLINNPSKELCSDPSGLLCRRNCSLVEILVVAEHLQTRFAAQRDNKLVSGSPDMLLTLRAWANVLPISTVSQFKQWAFDLFSPKFISQALLAFFKAQFSEYLSSLLPYFECSQEEEQELPFFACEWLDDVKTVRKNTYEYHIRYDKTFFNTEDAAHEFFDDYLTFFTAASELEQKIHQFFSPSARDPRRLPIFADDDSSVLKKICTHEINLLTEELRLFEFDHELLTLLENASKLATSTSSKLYETWKAGFNDEIIQKLVDPQSLRRLFHPSKATSLKGPDSAKTLLNAGERAAQQLSSLCNEVEFSSLPIWIRSMVLAELSLKLQPHRIQPHDLSAWSVLPMLYWSGQAGSDRLRQHMKIVYSHELVFAKERKRAKLEQMALEKREAETRKAEELSKFEEIHYGSAQRVQTLKEKFEALLKLVVAQANVSSEAEIFQQIEVRELLKELVWSYFYKDFMVPTCTDQLKLAVKSIYQAVVNLCVAECIETEKEVHMQTSNLLSTADQTDELDLLGIRSLQGKLDPEGILFAHYLTQIKLVEVKPLDWGMAVDKLKKWCTIVNYQLQIHTVNLTLEDLTVLTKEFPRFQEIFQNQLSRETQQNSPLNKLFSYCWQLGLLAKSVDICLKWYSDPASMNPNLAMVRAAWTVIEAAAQEATGSFKNSPVASSQFERDEIKQFLNWFGGIRLIQDECEATLQSITNIKNMMIDYSTKSNDKETQRRRVFNCCKIISQSQVRLLDLEILREKCQSYSILTPLTSKLTQEIENIRRLDLYIDQQFMPSSNRSLESILSAENGPKHLNNFLGTLCSETSEESKLAQIINQSFSQGSLGIAPAVSLHSVGAINDESQHRIWFFATLMGLAAYLRSGRANKSRLKAPNSKGFDTPSQLYSSSVVPTPTGRSAKSSQIQKEIPSQEQSYGAKMPRIQNTTSSEWEDISCRIVQQIFSPQVQSTKGLAAEEWSEVKKAITRRVKFLVDNCLKDLLWLPPQVLNLLHREGVFQDLANFVNQARVVLEEIWALRSGLFENADDWNKVIQAAFKEVFEEDEGVLGRLLGNIEDYAVGGSAHPGLQKANEKMTWGKYASVAQRLVNEFCDGRGTLTDPTKFKNSMTKDAEVFEARVNLLIKWKMIPFKMADWFEAQVNLRLGIRTRPPGIVFLGKRADPSENFNQSLLSNPPRDPRNSESAKLQMHTKGQTSKTPIKRLPPHHSETGKEYCLDKSLLQRFKTQFLPNMSSLTKQEIVEIIRASLNDRPDSSSAKPSKRHLSPYPSNNQFSSDDSFKIKRKKKEVQADGEKSVTNQSLNMSFDSIENKQPNAEKTGLENLSTLSQPSRKLSPKSKGFSELITGIRHLIQKGLSSDSILQEFSTSLQAEILSSIESAQLKRVHHPSSSQEPAIKKSLQAATPIKQPSSKYRGGSMMAPEQSPMQSMAAALQQMPDRVPSQMQSAKKPLGQQELLSPGRIGLPQRHFMEDERTVPGSRNTGGKTPKKVHSPARVSADCPRRLHSRGSPETRPKSPLSRLRTGWVPSSSEPAPGTSATKGSVPGGSLAGVAGTPWRDKSSVANSWKNVAPVVTALPNRQNIDLHRGQRQPHHSPN